MTRAALLAASALATAVALPAGAASPRPVRLVPNSAGAASKLVVDVNGGGSASAPIRGVHLLIARGFRIDGRAVAGRCTPAQAQRFACPASSRIGSGTASGHATGPLIPGGSYAFTADVDAYLAPPPQRGDVAGVVVRARERKSGQQGTATGRLVPLAHGRYGLELRFDDLARGAPQLPGTTVTLDRIALSAGASRRVHRTRHSLITNPPRCRAGGWPYELDVIFADHMTSRTGSAACRR